MRSVVGKIGLFGEEFGRRMMGKRDSGDRVWGGRGEGQGMMSGARFKDWVVSLGDVGGEWEEVCGGIERSTHRP